MPQKKPSEISLIPFPTTVLYRMSNIICMLLKKYAVVLPKRSRMER